MAVGLTSSKLVDNEPGKSGKFLKIALDEIMQLSEQRAAKNFGRFGY